MTILIAEDDPLQQRMLTTLIQGDFKHPPLVVSNGKRALEALKEDHEPPIRLIILDLDMPVMGGLEALSLIRESWPHIPVIMLTGSLHVDDAVQCIKAGASDYMTKPIETARFVRMLKSSLKISALHQEVDRLKRDKEGHFRFSDLIGYDSGLAASVKIGRKAAQSHIPVLLSGPTGSGKEIFARAIHGESIRRGNPFIAINCGAIPSQLIESVLFGHEKGSFTGAAEKTIGKFREAEGGTIFLDEIGELHADAQIKLLRVLQQKEVEPVGGKAVPVNVRIISATHRILENDVRAQKFREDLFFRLNVLEITLPSLAQRRGDIVALAGHFIARFCAQYNLPHVDITPAALDILMKRQWNGNVRELENTINRALVLRDGDSLTPSLFQKPRQSYEDMSFESSTSSFFQNNDGRFKTMEEIELDALKAALALYENNITQAAKALGMAKSTFYRKLSELTKSALIQ